MQLYILRHGIAEGSSSTGRDADRALTSEGKKKLRDVLKLAADAQVSPTLVLSSPYVRAMETAEIAASELGYKGEILRVKALTPDSDPESVWDEIRIENCQ